MSITGKQVALFTVLSLLANACMNREATKTSLTETLSYSDEELELVIAPWFHPDATHSNHWPDTLAQGDLDKASTDKLAHYLACSPKWLLTPSGDSLIAERRHLRDEIMRHADDMIDGTEFESGFIDDASETYRFLRMWIVLNGSSVNSVEVMPATGGQVFYIPDIPREAGVNLENYSSGCHIRYRGLTLEVFEESEFIATEVVSNAFRHMIEEVERGLGGSDIVSSTSLVIPPSISSNTCEAIGGTMDLTYRVIGLVNPKEKGLCYVTAVNMQGQLIETPNHINSETVEMCGWSDDDNVYLYNRWFIINVTNRRNEGKAGRFQLWFQPDSGAEPRMLCESGPITMYTWER